MSDPNNNGTGGVDDTVSDAPALAVIREKADNFHLFRGFGPFVVGVVLFVLMITLAPSVAPEHIVERPEGSAEVDEGGPVTTTARPTDSSADNSTTTTEEAP